MLELKDQHVLVLGLGDTGLSLARWLARRGARVRVADTRERPPRLGDLQRALPDIEAHCGAFEERSFEAIDLIAISPGIALNQPLLKQARWRGVPVVNDIELFAQVLPRAPRPKILAVTGSNGKTTVTAMLGAMCRAAGLKTEVAGNIGPPVLDALLRCEDEGIAPEVWALELSSFQLEITESLHADAATVLNLSEDHLDRYADLREYAAAKARIFRGARCQVLNRDDDIVMAMATSSCRQIRFGLGQPATDGDFGIVGRNGARWLAKGEMRLLPLDELPLAGLHNAANALAALALCRAIDLPLAPLQEALRQFEGLPHRVERIADIDSVTFYDDSKGTNVGATVAALSGLGQPVVLIAGGDGKGQDFAPLARPVADHARAVVLIGRDRDAIAAALAGTGVALIRAGDLVHAVSLAFNAAHCGDAVLLSPACASFDMFRDYRHRADVFISAVRELQALQLRSERKCSTRR